MNDINLIPSFGARARYYIAGAPFRVAGAIASLALIVGFGIVSGPSVTTFINGGFTNLQTQTAEASQPQTLSDNRDRVTASWVALIEERALAREDISEIEVSILSGEDTSLVSEYQNAITRADVLIENGTRDENALMSATAEIRSSVANLEYAVKQAECAAFDLTDGAGSAACLAE